MALTMKLAYINAGQQQCMWMGRRASDHHRRFQEFIHELFGRFLLDVVCLCEMGDHRNFLNGSARTPEELLNGLPSNISKWRAGPYMVLIRGQDCIEDVQHHICYFQSPCRRRDQMYVVSEINLVGRSAGALQPGPQACRSKLIVGLAHVSRCRNKTLSNIHKTNLLRAVVQRCIGIEGGHHIVVGGDYRLESRLMIEAIEDVQDEEDPWDYFETAHARWGDSFIYKGFPEVLDAGVPLGISYGPHHRGCLDAHDVVAAQLTLL